MSGAADPDSRTHVLVTGAAGRIGTAFRLHVGGRYRLRLVVRTTSIDDPGPHEVVSAELSDLDACRALCRGVDTVVHLAGDPSPTADFYESLLDNNIKASYNMFQAAYEEGCRRVILGGSVQAVDGYPLDVQVHPDMPVWPNNLYGVAKCFGEALARAYASRGLSSIVIRIGSYDTERMRGQMNPHRMSKFITARDMNRLLVQCIEAPDIDFALLHGISDNRFKRLDIEGTRKRVGYEPVDDSFRIFPRTVQHDDLWSR